MVRALCSLFWSSSYYLNPLRPRQNGRHFADDTLNRIFLNENVRISIKISLKCAPKGSINNIPALVQIMAWRRPGDKPLSESMMVSLLTHICVTRDYITDSGSILGISSVWQNDRDTHLLPENRLFFITSISQMPNSMNEHMDAALIDVNDIVLRCLW